MGMNYQKFEPPSSRQERQVKKFNHGEHRVHRASPNRSPITQPKNSVSSVLSAVKKFTTLVFLGELVLLGGSILFIEI
jgi:hypothetical protein